MMKITVQREKPTGNSTPGQMYLDETWQCYTMEPDPITPAIVGHPSIPAGTYPVQLTMSPHMQYVTPELIAVPGRTAIRIHIANYPHELEGCTAVGTKRDVDTVLNSRSAFDTLMQKLMAAGGPITAEYIDAV
jgi:Family of unknown function (DUF5675)